METILVVNAGSSSVKFQLFARNGAQLVRRVKGQVDGIAVRPRLKASEVGGKSIDRELGPDQGANVPAAMAAAGEWLRSELDISPSAVGHRVVHGGPDFDRPVIVNARILEQLSTYESLAPLHQPNNLAPIRTLLERFPALPQIACFDTSFHRGRDKVADCYAIPLRFYDKGIRRYGFHGLSYEFIAGQLKTIAPELGKVIVAHLGSGASMCAIHEGRSVESTMGFTALDGLPMGTRPGQIDPGVVLHLILQEKMSAGDVQDLFYKESGLKGLSGISNDVRELQGSPDPRARFALDHFARRIALNAGMLAAALGGLEAFVFTAGIGENSPNVRSDVISRLGWLGAELDEQANEAGLQVISTPGSRVKVLVLSTDEELMIARHTAGLLEAR
jgi:acetate kinase